MAKKWLTLDDLVKFCRQNNFAKFSSAESGYKLAVQVPAVFEEDTNVDDNHRGMLKLKVKILHTGLNRNGSFVSESAAKKAMSTIADRPLLGAIHQLENGEWDFEAHNSEIVENENGEYEVNYIESQIGSFSSEKPFFEHDDELDKDFVCAYAYIAEEYTKAADIIRKKNGTKNSCELCIDEMSFNAKDNYLSLDEFYVSASTLLGSRYDGTEVQEGMQGSRADIVDFSAENNSIQYDQILEAIQGLKESIDSYTKENKEGGTTEVENEIFEEVTTETEEVIIEEAAEEVTEEETTEDVIVEESASEEVSEDTEDVTPEVGMKYSVTIGDVVKEFSVSLTEKLEALSALVNDTYSEADMTWYSVDVYEDEKSVVMIDCWNGRAYKQSYKVRNDAYTLTGDRVPVYSVWCTEDERKELDKMRSNYSLIEAKLAQYEAEPEKMSILNEECYAQIADIEEFVELKDEKNHFEMSVDEVKAKADAILLDYAKQGKIKFVEKKENVVSNKTLPTIKKRPSRYGNLFAK